MTNDLTPETLAGWRALYADMSKSACIAEAMHAAEKARADKAERDLVARKRNHDALAADAARVYADLVDMTRQRDEARQEAEDAHMTRVNLANRVIALENRLRDHHNDRVAALEAGVNALADKYEGAGEATMSAWVVRDLRALTEKGADRG